jgi:polyribonucleotide nucleotidyltransferase
MEEVVAWHDAPYTGSEARSFVVLVSRQNWSNFALWHEEDKARDPRASDQEIAQVKRNIDKLNQQRNDLIEQLDEALLQHLASQQDSNLNAPLNSETPGSIIDRLSINALKIFHMREEVERDDASEAHQEKCAAKLEILQEQRADLGQSLTELWDDLQNGRKRLKVYRQMKMYNDPSLNPVLYRQTSQES